MVKTQYDCATIVVLLRGFAKGIPTKWLTDETDLAYPSVLKRRRRIQESVQNGERVGLPENRPEGPEEDSEEGAEPSDQEVEVDEMYQHAGEKGGPHRDPNDPPRQRANKQRGRGTYANDCVPIVGLVCRETGSARFEAYTKTTYPGMSQCLS